MKKTHVVIITIIFLLMVSLTFAQEGQRTYVSGDVAAVNTPNGVVLEGEQVAVTVPIQGTAKPRTQTMHRAKVNQQAAATKATQVQNAASLKKGEPRVKVSTTSTETDVYNVDIKNKKGTTDYGVVEQTVTGPKGKQTTQGVVYSAYAPSKAALTNDKKTEISLAGGATMMTNKDNRDDKYGSIGLGTSVSMLYAMNNYLSVGVDYMMLHPKGKTHNDGVQERHYHGMYAHDISLAGKLTFNPWDNFRIYSPMGVGMMNARMKTVIDGADDSENKWGAALYIGAGMQYDITDCMFAGLEYRYTYGFISDKDLSDQHKDRDLQFHTVMLRLGMRF